MTIQVETSKAEFLKVQDVWEREMSMFLNTRVKVTSVKEVEVEVDVTARVKRAAGSVTTRK